MMRVEEEIAMAEQIRRLTAEVEWLSPKPSPSAPERTSALTWILLLLFLATVGYIVYAYVIEPGLTPDLPPVGTVRSEAVLVTRPSSEAPSLPDGVRSFFDAEHETRCYTFYSHGISCVPSRTR